MKEAENGRIARREGGATAPRPPRIDPTAIVSREASIGEGAQVWGWVQIREGSSVGPGTILGKSVYIDDHVTVGANVKIQNNVSVYRGVTIEDGAFVGPHVCFTNDRFPRAINPDGSLKGVEDWQVSPIRVGQGASIGANSTIVAGVKIGAYAMVAAGAVVTHDVPDHALVMGVPARQAGWVCRCGSRLSNPSGDGSFECEACRSRRGASGG